jgi:hypothetical protein
MVLPEWVISGAPDHAVQQITNTLECWLSHPEELAAARADLEILAETAIQTGAHSRAADAILEVLDTAELRRAA